MNYKHEKKCELQISQGFYSQSPVPCFLQQGCSIPTSPSSTTNWSQEFKCLSLLGPFSVKSAQGGSVCSSSHVNRTPWWREHGEEGGTAQMRIGSRGRQGIRTRHALQSWLLEVSTISPNSATNLGSQAPTLERVGIVHIQVVTKKFS